MPRPADGQGNRDRCQKWYTDYSTEMVLERKKIKIKIMVAKEMIGDMCNSIVTTVMLIALYGVV